MKKIKKLTIIIVTMMLAFTLQFNTSLKKGMEEGFTFSKLAKNLFVKEARADDEDWWFHHICEEYYLNKTGYVCTVFPATMGCTEYYDTCVEIS